MLFYVPLIGVLLYLIISIDVVFSESLLPCQTGLYGVLATWQLWIVTLGAFINRAACCSIMFHPSIQENFDKRDNKSTDNLPA
jgi:hypothetical protein